jgi:hypothetical protein
MAFRIRDLMVNVMPRGGTGAGRVAMMAGTFGGICDAFTCAAQSQMCADGSAFDLGGQFCDLISGEPTNCQFGTANTCLYTCNTTAPICVASCPNFTCPPVTYRCPALRASAVVVTPVNNWRAFASRDLAALKEQLRTALAEVEAQEKAAEEASRPRTREEADELEEKLKGALEEVRGWKKTLPSGGSK